MFFFCFAKKQNRFLKCFIWVKDYTQCLLCLIFQQKQCASLLVSAFLFETKFYRLNLNFYKHFLMINYNWEKFISMYSELFIKYKKIIWLTFSFNTFSAGRIYTKLFPFFLKIVLTQIRKIKWNFTKKYWWSIFLWKRMSFFLHFASTAVGAILYNIGIFSQN